MLKRFESIPAFVDAASKAPEHKFGESASWYGNITFKRAQKLALAGDESLVPKAQDLLDKLETTDVETRGRRWSPAPCGAYPVIAEVLAGEPMCMRMPLQADYDTAPLNVYVGINCSAIIDAEQTLNRGVAILALIMKLQQVRPVTLRLITTMHGVSDGNCVFDITLGSTPLDLSVACFTLTHTGFDRHLTHSLAKHLDKFNGKWAKLGWLDTPQLRKYVGMSDKDLYVPPSHATDTQVLTDPLSWVNDKVKHYTQQEQELVA